MQVISLFSGIGGFELPAEWVGWDVVASCEINPFGRNILKYYWPNAYHHNDIKTLDYETLKENSKWDPAKPTIVVGGFPCQGFSVAGKRLGTDDDRYLWPEMLRVINFVKPTWVLGENVTGILSMEDKSGVWAEVFPIVEARKIIRYDTVDHYEAIYSRQAKMLVSTICETLEEAGFEVQPLAIPAGSVGLIHRRERIWFLGYSQHNGCLATQVGGNDNQPPFASGQEQVGEFTGASGVQSSRVAQLQNSELHSNPVGFGHQGRAAGNDYYERGQVYQNVENNGDGVWGKIGGRGEISPHPNGLNGREQLAKPSRDREGTRNQSGGSSSENATHPHPDHGQAGSKQPEQPRPTPTGTGGEFYSDTRSPGLQEFNIADLANRQRYLTRGNIEDWTNWPTQPPICTGNDEFSARLDPTPIFEDGKPRTPERTYSYWRNESIKGAGNAVAPAVVYQIYKAIQANYETQNP